MVGDEAALRAGIGRLRDVGVTDFNAAVIAPPGGNLEATLALLQSEVAT